MDDFWSDGFRLNYDEDEFYPDQLKVALADAIVMSIFFVRVGSSLILDLRTAEGVDPAVFVDGMTPTRAIDCSRFAICGRSSLFRMRSPWRPGPSACPISSGKGSCSGCSSGATKSAVAH